MKTQKLPLRERLISEQKVRAIHNNVQVAFEEDIQVNVFVKKRVPKTDAFVMIFQAKLTLELIRNLSFEELKIYIYLVSISEYDNIIPVDVKTIMEALQYKSRSSISQAVKKLKERNMLLTIPYLQDMRRNTYVLNPMLSWKGKIANKMKALAEMKANNTQLELQFPPHTKK